MANLSELFPQVPQLTGWGAGMVSADQHKNALMNADLNRLSWAQDYGHNQQINPLKVKNEQELLTSRQQANKKGLMEMNDYERLREPTYKSKLEELSANSDEATLKKTMVGIQRNLMSPDPATREQAQKMFMLTGDMLKLKEQYRLAGNNQMQVAGIRAAKQGGGATKETRDRWQEAYDKSPPVNKLAMIRDRIATMDQSDPNYGAWVDRYNSVASLVNEAKPQKPVPVTGPDGKITLQAPPGITPVAPGIALPPKTPNRNAAPTNADEAKRAGWVLLPDKHGNKAYVSPDGKSFFEVK